MHSEVQQRCNRGETEVAPLGALLSNMTNTPALSDNGPSAPQDEGLVAIAEPCCSRRCSGGALLQQAEGLVAVAGAVVEERYSTKKGGGISGTY